MSDDKPVSDFVAIAAYAAYAAFVGAKQIVVSRRFYEEDDYKATVRDYGGRTVRAVLEAIRREEAF